jgi:hypothetical protein
MYGIAARRTTSGELLKKPNGPRIDGGCETGLNIPGEFSFD